MKTRLKNISSIGEFGIIDIIKNNFAQTNKNKSIIAGLGDDAFCFKIGQEIFAITKDLLIEDVHFTKIKTNPFDLAQKSIEVNISDLASMGYVKPKYIFIGLGMPKNTSVDFVKEFSRGLKAVCNKYGAIVAGGDTVKAEKIIISITAVGIVKGKVIKRSGAKTGDLIGVTNTFGDAGAGLKLLSEFGAKRIYNKEERQLISKQNSPKARIKEAQKISKYINAMTDASDGLYFSIDLIAKASKKGAEINISDIPISKQLKSFIQDEKERLNYALFGAEDYELVFTAPAKKAKILKKLVPQISFIGTINNTKRIVYVNKGKKENIKYSGFKHF
ncbi:MAG: thiamine-phosphate kinase [Elusimicrobiota bacterium]|jgi:thiamine-monophosphate kinase|nr:thiamine-phosphate kinase [Elusimicrobiota bacterium]